MNFFPCTRFEAQILLSFWGSQWQDKNKTDIEKLERDLRLHEELHENYSLITMLSIICLKRNLKMVFENPYSEQHYLQRYWCLKPSLIDKDRTMRGDYYIKPTQYWFFNCEPSNNIIFEPMEINAVGKVEDGKAPAKTKQEARSMIHPTYANRFIREFIL